MLALESRLQIQMKLNLLTCLPDTHLLLCSIIPNRPWTNTGLWPEDLEAPTLHDIFIDLVLNPSLHKQERKQNNQQKG